MSKNEDNRSEFAFQRSFSGSPFGNPALDVLCHACKAAVRAGQNPSVSEHLSEASLFHNYTCIKEFKGKV